jgi:hypothetical protein
MASRSTPLQTESPKVAFRNGSSLKNSMETTKSQSRVDASSLNNTTITSKNSSKNSPLNTRYSPKHDRSANHSLLEDTVTVPIEETRPKYLPPPKHHTQLLERVLLASGQTMILALNSLERDKVTFKLYYKDKDSIPFKITVAHTDSNHDPWTPIQVAYILDTVETAGVTVVHYDGNEEDIVAEVWIEVSHVRVKKLVSLTMIMPQDKASESPLPFRISVKRN